MRIRKTGMYSVAPLSQKDRDTVIRTLRKVYPGASGIPSFDICKVVASVWPDVQRNHCAGRPDIYRPCKTLCYIHVEIQYQLLQQNRAFLRRQGLGLIMRRTKVGPVR